jgi:hypothetical protein
MRLRGGGTDPFVKVSPPPNPHPQENSRLGGCCETRAFPVIPVAKSSDRIGREIDGWLEAPERRSDGFASLVCSHALRMRIILDACEHQSTKSLSIARLCQWGPTRYGNSGREYPMTFSMAKGRSRHPTWNESDKTFGNPYTCYDVVGSAGTRRRLP